jgi:hypothetical protein
VKNPSLSGLFRLLQSDPAPCPYLFFSDSTASRDLKILTELNVFVKEGEKKGTFYKLKFGG